MTNAPKQSADPTERPAGYDAAYYLSRKASDEGHAEQVIIRDLAGEHGRGAVIDVGCGVGELLDILGPRRGIGIDTNAMAIDMATEAFPDHQFRLGDACNLGVEPGSVDCIVSCHLFEHLSDPQAALAAWHAALRPGGRLVIATPNGRSAHPEIFHDDDHKHIYTGDELAAMVARANFTVERILTVLPWGVPALMKVPFLWRLQASVSLRRLPRVPLLRWLGVTLMLSAVKPDAAN